MDNSPRKCSFFLERRTQVEHVVVIHGVDNHGRAANGGPAEEEQSLPSKVPMPLMTTGVIERGVFSGERIDPNQIRLFVKIAMIAPNCEIG
jgi:hypothetical protein